MIDGAAAVFVALEQSDFASTIRQSVWLYPAANVSHIIFLFLFAAALGVMDVRLLGGLAATDPARLLARARAFAIVALAGMVLSGLMLFSAEAGHLALNPVFQLKLTLIAAGGVNIALYEFMARPEVQRLAPGIPMPARARLAGLLSLLIWIAVAACGRSIAYF